MTLLAQLSDLHFGSEEPATTQALIDELNREPPDLVILSGDLTLAARTDEFVRARKFIDTLNAPTLAVPGNHDITPYKLLERFLKPYGRWQKHISRDIEPSWANGDTTVVGLNTARRLRLKLDWSHGSLSHDQLEKLPARFASAGPDCFRIVVAHHPFIDEANVDLSDRPSALVHRAKKALAAFVEQRVDLVTAGHLHRTYTAAFGGPDTDQPSAAERGADQVGGPEDLVGTVVESDTATGAIVAKAGEPRHRVTVIQAGTALSYRTRGEANSFNRIEITGGRLAVHPVTWYGTRWERDPDPLVVIDRPSSSKG